MTSADVVVVGGGPAGIGAALAAAEVGARAILIDEQPALGGALCWRTRQIAGLGGELEGLPGIRLAEALERRVAAAGVGIATSTVAWAIFEDNALGTLGPTGSRLLRAGAVILATGSTDVVSPFPGWTRPGVLTARAAQICLNQWRVLPGRRVAVIGAGPEADEVAADVELAGAETVCRVPGIDQVAAEGHDAVERLRIGPEIHALDLVVIALGRQPDCSLAQQALADLAYVADRGGFVPRRDSLLRTSRPGLYVVGDAAGVGGSVAEQLAEGRLAGLSAAGASADRIGQARVDLDARRATGPVGKAMVTGAGVAEVSVCRCEGVGAAEIRAAIQAGARTLNDVKRQTRAGMGVCQGALCRGALAGLLGEAAGIEPDQLAPMTARPPTRPIPFRALIDSGLAPDAGPSA